MLFSSLSSILGGVGFVAYAAANACMDAFAHRYSQSDDTLWISVNWEGWSFGERSEQHKTIGAMVAELSITPEEGQRLFQRILATDLGPQLAISTGDVQARIDYWIKRAAFRDGAHATGKDGVAHARPQLHTSHVAPRNDLEHVVAGIWQELLGIEQIGVHDSFFELGGDSLMGTELVARIRRVFQVDLPLKTFFHAATIAEVAQALVEHEPLPGQVEQIAQVWNQIERMDAEDVLTLLQEKQTAREEL